MKTVEVIDLHGEQAVKLPGEFRFEATSVTIRKAGDAVILEPIKATQWPPGFFEDITISDPAWDRPAQGSTPPAPTFS